MEMRWKKIKVINKEELIYIAPNGALFYSIKEIKNFHKFMFGQNNALADFLKDLEKAVISLVWNKVELNEIIAKVLKNYGQQNYCFESEDEEEKAKVISLQPSVFLIFRRLII